MPSKIMKFLKSKVIGYRSFRLYHRSHREVPWLGYFYIKSQEPGFQPQPNYLPQFGANYAVSLNLILFIFYFEIVLALPFLQSCKEYKVSEWVVILQTSW